MEWHFLIKKSVHYFNNKEYIKEDIEKILYDFNDYYDSWLLDFIEKKKFEEYFLKKEQLENITFLKEYIWKLDFYNDIIREINIDDLCEKMSTNEALKLIIKLLLDNGNEKLSELESYCIKYKEVIKNLFMIIYEQKNKVKKNHNFSKLNNIKQVSHIDNILKKIDNIYKEIGNLETRKYILKILLKQNKLVNNI
jgi:hypothetical protein